MGFEFTFDCPGCCRVITDCCGNLSLPEVLYLTITGEEVATPPQTDCGGCAAGAQCALTFNPNLTGPLFGPGWEGTLSAGCWDDTPVSVQFACLGAETWELAVVAGDFITSGGGPFATCDPFQMSGFVQGYNQYPLTTNGITCGAGVYSYLINWTVTE